MRLAVTVQGLYEKSDSIGYDAVAQYRILKEKFGADSVRIFAEKVNSEWYPDIPVENISSLKFWENAGSDPVIIIYHFCDGWPSFEEWLRKSRCRLVVRWHNNTPPWFFAKYSLAPVGATMRGFNHIVALSRIENAEFWVNSEYSRRQLRKLGLGGHVRRVVYPISAYLRDDMGMPVVVPDHGVGAIRVLFVGRVVPHKGHKHLVAACALMKRALNREVELFLPGREDSSMHEYVEEIKLLSSTLGLSVHFPGEVSSEDLTKLYKSSTVFACLSEHEGFGLPVFEAMRMGLPVVSLKSTALKEFLSDHPLAVDDIDYVEIAARMIAALDSQIRESVVRFQSEHILSRYSLAIVRNQILAALAEDTLKEPPLSSNSRDESAIARTVEQWHLRLKAIYDELPVLKTLPSDLPNGYVTLYDVSAYSALLRGGFQNTGDFYDLIIKGQPLSTRPVIGTFINFARKVVVRMESGVVNAIAQLDGRDEERMKKLFRQVENIRVSVKHIDVIESEISSITKYIKHTTKSGKSNMAWRNEFAVEKEVGDTAVLYDRKYFEGGRSKSNYGNYEESSRGPSLILANTLRDLFAPETALEVGCAVGNTVKALRGLNIEAFGVDISEWAVTQANVPFIRRLDFSKDGLAGEFDLVFCYDVVEHIPQERLSFAMKNLWKVTGKWLVIVPAMYPEGTTSDPNEPTHLIFHDRQWWEALIKNCGITLDAEATEMLERSEHSRTFDYTGRVFVARKALAVE